MDNHFEKTPFDKNIPIILGVLSIWYNNFFNSESEAVIPYSEYLKNLPKYLQQSVMESNGKSVDRNGNKINYQTGTLIWGSTGTNAQHAFFQLIHQGTKLIPLDFIGFKKSLHDDEKSHKKLMSNFIAQSEALMLGKKTNSVIKELKLNKLNPDEINKISPFKVFEGNRPSNAILFDSLTPHSLGKLIALYEHKIFVQGIIWNIYSYDQFGVELGKILANKILEDIAQDEISDHDASTSALIQMVKSK